MSHEIEPKLVCVTPEYAEKILRDCTYERGRTLDESAIQQYATDMLMHRFAVTTFHLLTLKGTGQSFLGDANHRFRAVIRSNTPVQMIRAETVYDTMDEIHARYGHFDRGRQRRPNDVIRALGAEEQFGLPSTHANQLVASISVLMDGFEHQHPGGKRWQSRLDWKIEGAREWKEYAVRYFNAIHGRPKDVSSRMIGMVAVAFGIVTFRFAPDKASEFWPRVAQNDGLKRGSGEQNMFLAMKEASATEVAQAATYARLLAKCWNASVDGKPLMLRRVQSSELDKHLRIAGTPYDGTDVRLWLPSALIERVTLLYQQGQLPYERAASWLGLDASDDKTATVLDLPPSAVVEALQKVFRSSDIPEVVDQTPRQDDAAAA